MSKTGISIRAYAQHRGVHHRAVQNAIKEGRITQLEDGTIDPAIADQEWTANTNMMKSHPKQLSSLQSTQELKLKHETGLLRLKLQRETGLVVPKDEVRKFISLIFTDLKEKFIARGTRLAPRLAHQNDIAKIARLLEEDTKQMISEYRNELDQRISTIDTQASDLEDRDS